MTGREHFHTSLESVQQALVHLRDGLVTSGFADAVDTYGRMAEVVVAQRVLATIEADSRFNSLFETIATTAAEVRDLLAPWIPLMEKLAGMNTSTEELRRAFEVGQGPTDQLSDDADPAKQRLDEAEQAILTWLRAHRGPQPNSRIRAGVSLTAEAVSEALDSLIAKGFVIARHSGHRLRWEAVAEEGRR
jgi:hypothetical protein